MQGRVWGRGYKLHSASSQKTTRDLSAELNLSHSPCTTIPHPQALSQKGQLLLATSNMCISDTGEPRPLMWRQLFLLIPSGDAPAFLLRHLACREQLLPPTQVGFTAAHKMNKSPHIHAEY